MDISMFTLLKDYGVLGLWTATLLYRQLVAQKQTEKLITNNTIALNRVYGILIKCQKI